MGLLEGKGYANRGSVFTFTLPNGENTVYSSNACRYEDVIKKAKLPNGTKLNNSTTVYLSNGKNKKKTYIRNIWVVKGAIPSGQNGVEYLIKIGSITEEQATAILNEKTATL